MPYTCNINKFKIERVVNWDGKELKPDGSEGWENLFGLDNEGNFTFKTTKDAYKYHRVYISFASDAVKSPIIHALNVSLTPFFSFNPNTAPVFEGVKGYELNPITLYIDHNYKDTEFKLPKIYDLDGNNVHIHYKAGKESTFMYFDKRTNGFRF